MSNENIHINLGAEGYFPQPDIPVDDAWDNMKALLTDDSVEPPILIPPTGGNNGNGDNDGNGNKFIKFGAVIAALICIAVCWNLIRKTNTTTLSDNKKQTVTQQKNSPAASSSIVVSSTMIRSSSITSTNKKSTRSYTTNTLNRSEDDRTASIRKKKDHLNTFFNHYNSSNTIGTLSSENKNNEAINTDKTATANDHSRLSNKKGSMKISSTAPQQVSDVTYAYSSNKNNNTLIRNNHKKYKHTATSATDNDDNIAVAANPISKQTFTTNNNKTRNSDSKTKIFIHSPLPDSSAVDDRSMNQNHQDTGLQKIKDALVKATTNDTTKIKKTNKPDLLNTVNAGLQWNFNIPMQNNSAYFIAAKGKSEPFLLLLPSIWISKKFDRQEIMLQFTPYQQNFVNQKFISSYSSQTFTKAVYKATYLDKTFGLSVGLQYNYRIFSSFLIGVGVNYNTQQRSLLNDYGKSELSGNTTGIDSSYGAKGSSSESVHLNPSFVSGKLELAYTKNKFDIGIDCQKAFTNLSAEPDIDVKPLTFQVFFRWRIKSSR
ncbi:MAG TPA: hypothetical protein VK559_07115 [Ferruginibacter sp.]|nr:hypothetical protein [Ferruginibacter sp.]